ncbi:catalase family peroxidase [Hyalangium versicolor]|uniref:catalase family peroxidase n=1 Tax=Hyalangium versicolor TaxID=2861190 RepID=UPI001CCFAE60|nr:catalase family peroxidase [Hyalangium versicolor]
MAELVQEAVNAMEEHTGTVKGYRRAHPRGLVFHATFTPTPEARALTTAEHFQGPPVHTLVRFSNASGSPYAPDHQEGRQGAVLGLAVRFDLASGKHATWAAATIPAFIARNPKEFLQITRAQRAGGSPNPLRMAWYILTHLHTLTGIKGIVGNKPTPSFAHCQYNSVHAYHLVDAQGQRRAFRYRWEPSAGVATLPPAEARQRPAQYLLDEIRERVTRERVSWNLVFQLANPGDATHDATRPWPENRQKVAAGQLTLDTLYEDQRESELFVFDPTGVVPGIELSDDPILHFRSKVYSESFNRRSHETKPEPKPADMRQ